MPGEIDILEIDHSPSQASQVSGSDVAFTVINDGLSETNFEEDGYGLNNSFPSNNFKKSNSYRNNRYTGYDPKKSFHKQGINLDGSNMSDDFVNTLDAKLKDLQEDSKKKRNYKNKESRPLFITTVKTGIFLDPPPELAAILGYPRSYNASSGSNNSEKSSDGLMYSFSSQPRVLNNKAKPKVNNDKQPQTLLLPQKEKLQVKNNNIRAKRDVGTNNFIKKIDKPPPEAIPYGNVMYDRRVVRGPAFMHHPLPTVGLETPAARQAEARRRAMARRKAQNTRARNLRLRMGTPPPVEGRKHEDIQTEEYLEELFEHPVTDSVFTQTDYFVDRPPTPKFIPVKTGMDVSTQIYPGELFHFDIEVRPILEVLVGKTVEQALIEVMEEDELASIREQQRRFKEIRDAEKAEEERLEEEENRKRREMQLRVLEQEDAIRDQRATEDRIAAAVLTTGYIADLLPNVIKDLSKGGFLYDEVTEEVDEKFMPWLMKEVKTEMQKMVENRDFLSDILREIIETRAEIYTALGEREERMRGLPEIEGEEDEVGSALPNMDEMVAEEGEEEMMDEETHIDSASNPFQESVVSTSELKM